MIPGTLNNDLYFNLDRASLLMRRQVLEVLNEYDVSPEQWEILQYLDEQTGVSQSKLTHATLKDKGNVSRIVARMVRDGWVERRPGESDSRSVFIFLTQKGSRIRDRVPMLLQQQTDTLLVPLADNERGELLDILKKLRVLLGDNNVTSQPTPPQTPPQEQQL